MSDNDDRRPHSTRARPRAMSRSRLGIEAAAETAAWQHGPAVPVRSVERPLSRPTGTYRGRGPRGYVRSLLAGETPAVLISGAGMDRRHLAGMPAGSRRSYCSLHRRAGADLVRHLAR